MSETDDTIRFSVSLPRPLLEELDRQLIRPGYTSRSEFVRDLIREKMVEAAWEGAEEGVMGVLTIIYDHHQRDLSQRIIDVQHRGFVHVLCATHVHMDESNCLETIVLQGRPAEIEHISNEIGGLRGVRFARLTRASQLSV